MKPLQSLYRDLRQDLNVVTARLTLERKSGKVEGSVSMVKRINTDRYGRAGFDLLQRRFPLAD